MPRITPISAKSDVPAEHHELVDGVIKRFGHIRGPFSILLHSPGLAEHVFALGGYFREQCVVEPRFRLLAILIAARERRGAYVWSAQAAAAKREGIPDAIVELVRTRADASKYPAEEREVVTYAEQLLRTSRVDQAAFDALVKRHGAQWLVELTVVMNYYGMLSGVVSAFEVPTPADGDPLPK